MTYKIEIKEVRTAFMYIDADRREEALEKAEDKYYEEISDWDSVLEVEDTTFEIKKIMRGTDR